MKIVYLGYVVSPKEAERDSGVSVAGNKMQWNVVKNLSQIPNVQITCVTVTPLAAFPREKKLFSKFHREELAPGVVSYKIPFCNIPIIKQFWQIIAVYRQAKKTIQETGADLLFCYNLYPQIGIPMRWLKKRFPGLDTVCLLADLPFDYNPHRSRASAWLCEKMNQSTWKSMRLCDRYVALNETAMKTYLPNKPYIVVDGGISESDIEKYSEPVKKTEEYNVLYCGALTETNGITDLLSAMELLQSKDVFLDIYGAGYLDQAVKAAAEKNMRIRYHGKVSNAKVMEEQKKAWVLINPRRIDDPISKVTFPSKTFEYLLSGTPVLTTRLKGYGEEYNDKMIFIDKDDSASIARAIDALRATATEDLRKTAERAKEFVISEKSWSNQSVRIKNFLEAFHGIPNGTAQ